MKKKLAILLVGTMIASSILAGCGSKKSEPTKKETSGELKGDITFWHSFTQGPRMEVIQQTADQFMKDNPGVKIKIETFSWGDFYTKWTTGLASGNVPDMSTALPGHVVEMMDADALEPVDDLIDDIGRNKFSKTALSEGKKDGTCYSLPLYSHAQVMWYRKDLLQKAGLSVPKTWDEFAEAAKTLTKDGVNVFCEKPIALSYQDCDDMVRACQEHGVIFMAGHVMNFFHGVRHAKKLINDGVIGKVLYCHSARNGWEEQQPTISWKKIREKSGGHLYHHIHELDCVQFLMGGMPEEVTMTGGNVAHQGEAFGDEDDMLFVNMQFSDNRYAVLEWGSAFHWPEHYVLIQGTKGAIKIDMCDCGGTLKIDGKDEHFLVHESQEEDDDRTRIYHSTEMDGAIMYGKVF